MPDKARLGMAAALGVLLSSGSAVASAAPAGNQYALSQEQLSHLPPGLWGLLGLLGLFGLVGVSRRGPKRNGKNPLAGYSGEDDLTRPQGRHHAAPGQRPMEFQSGADRNPQAERPPTIGTDPAAAQMRPEAAPMPDPRRPVTRTPSDVPMPSYASFDAPSGSPYGMEAPPGNQYGNQYGSQYATPAGGQPWTDASSGGRPYAAADTPSGSQPIPGYGTETSSTGPQPYPMAEPGGGQSYGTDTPAGVPSYPSAEPSSNGQPYPTTVSSGDQPYPAAETSSGDQSYPGELPGGHQSYSGEVPTQSRIYASPDGPSGAQQAYAADVTPGMQAGSPMDTAPTAPTPALYRRNPEPFPQTDQDQPPAVPQQQGTGTFAGLPRYPDAAAPDGGPVDAVPRHQR
ncbi:hypothetical protein [Amycolatopsis granulosa]|uniref:hypothetical protein n=1 Tax=Amycolatopsis granulosa TaxID=185684 RepID=UPI0014223F83|nr:hypothetical protein [Amycolatopsis granulosa]NIH85530.1 hypothetical protein [Amycolatopsis granulosa]